MKSIGIFIGEFVHYWDENTVKQGMGGSETWAIEIGKQFALKGYKVIMYAYPEVEHDVINNFTLKRTDSYFKDIESGISFNYFIYSRLTGAISPYLKCDNVFHISHDVRMITPVNREYYIGQGKVKGYLYLSEWHKSNLLLAHKNTGLTDKMMYKVSNGFSNQFYENIDIDNKENSIVWSSSPDRGFDVFYKFVFLPLLFKFSDLKLYVCYPCYNAETQTLMNSIALLPGVEVLGKLSKEELSEYQKKSKIWVYPGIFPETFCITAIENAAAGNVIIAPLTYGLSTTLDGLQYVKDINLPALSEGTADIYKTFITNVINDDNLRKTFANQSIDFSKTYSWERAADEIINIFNICEK